VLLAGYGFAAMLAGVAPKDPPHAAHTLTSQVHVGATIVGGAALFAAMALVAVAAPSPFDRRLAGTVISLTGIGVVAFPFTWGSPVYGLVELFLLTAATSWLVAITLRSLSRTSEPPFLPN
jgi:hypothetical protein